MYLTSSVVLRVKYIRPFLKPLYSSRVYSELETYFEYHLAEEIQGGLNADDEYVKEHLQHDSSDRYEHYAEHHLLAMIVLLVERLAPSTAMARAPAAAEEQPYTR